VEELGTVVDLERGEDAAVLVVSVSDALTAEIRRGDSYAVNGVCLTATEHTAQAAGRAAIRFDVMGETLRHSALGALHDGDPVNVERPVRLADRLGGHLVQGHCDGVATILERTPAPHWELVRVSLPGDLARYVVVKGSIPVDGISLTVAAIDDTSFSVALIPETLARTTLGSKGVGESVNLEVDVLGKYVERLLDARGAVQA
jgi:riboflavin synthase